MSPAPFFASLSLASGNARIFALDDDAFCTYIYTHTRTCVSGRPSVSPARLVLFFYPAPELRVARCSFPGTFFFAHMPPRTEGPKSHGAECDVLWEMQASMRRAHTASVWNCLTWVVERFLGSAQAVIVMGLPRNDVVTRRVNYFISWSN